MALKHIEKTAIATPFDVLESPYVTFGLHNAAQVCPRLVDLVTQGLDCCHPYMDNTFISNIDKEEHLKHQRILYRSLSDYSIIINVAKYVFEVPVVLFQHCWYLNTTRQGYVSFLASPTIQELHAGLHLNYGFPFKKKAEIR